MIFSNSKCKLLSLRCFFILTVFFISASCSESINGKTAIDLSGRWDLIRHGSEFPACEAGAKHESISITLPGNWNNILAENEDRAATVWLCKTIRIGGPMPGVSFILSLGRIGVADETYFNGALVGRSGQMPREGDFRLYRSAWQTPRNYFIPHNLVKPGEDNVIMVRVFSHVVSGTSGDIELIPEKEYDSRTLFGFQPVTAAHSSLFAFNIVLLAIFIFIYLGNMQRREYLLAVILLLGAAVLHLLVLGISWPADGVVRMKLMLMMYTAALLVFTFFSEFYFKVSVKYVLPALSAFCLVIFISIALAPTTDLFIRYSGGLYIAFNILYHLYVPYILAVSIVRDPMRYWYLTIVSGIALIMDFYYLHCVISMNLFDVPFHVSQVSILTMLVLFIFVNEYHEMKKQNQSIARALLYKNREVQKLHRLYDASKKGKYREGPREIINDVIEYLDANYLEPYDRKSLAGRFSIKEDYMCQVFKKKTGTNISNYINAMRIEAAKKLLEDTETRVVDIAFHAGFENLTHFHRLFKKITGKTPNVYRESIKDSG
jgi:AraC-like DNA-binding protein